MADSERAPLLATYVPGVGWEIPWDPTRRKLSSALILVSLTLERLAFYGVLANLFLFLNHGNTSYGSSWDPVKSMNAVLLLSGVSCLSSPFTGWLADAVLGRFMSIVFGFILYIIGYSFLTALAAHKLPESICFSTDGSSDPKSPCDGVVYLILVIIGLAAGTVRANMAPFGAEQVRAAGTNAVRSFFSWLYWCINLGSVLGIGILAYIEQSCKMGWFWSYLACTFALLIALICFCLGRSVYVRHQAGGSIITNIFRIIINAIKTRRTYTFGSPYVGSLQGTIVRPSWIDYAKISYGGSFHEGAVEDVKALGRIIIVFLSLLPYQLIYDQMQTSFQAQALHMKVYFGYNDTLAGLESQPKFHIPAPWLSLFDVVFLLIFIPLLEGVVYPCATKCGCFLSLLLKIPVGMAFSMIAVLTAGGLETYRLYLWDTDPSSHIQQTISGTLYSGVNLSILYQVPQYILVGLAELFAGLSGIHYAYYAAPKSLQGIIMGLYMAMQGLGNFLGIGLIAVMKSIGWLSSIGNDDFNKFHLDFYFYVLGGLQLVALIIYIMFIYMKRTWLNNDEPETE